MHRSKSAMPSPTCSLASSYGGPPLTRIGRHESEEHGDQDPLTITFFPPSPSDSLASVNTYDSLLSDEAPDELDVSEKPTLPLPPCRPFTSSDASLRPSDPYLFSRLFPSMNRLSIRHDGATPDGNMNLRVDIMIGPESPVPRLRSNIVQLFHLRMHDLERREFSLRRYCRDSGREVCFSKRGYTVPSGPSSAVSAALRSVKTPFRKSTAASSSTLSSSSSCSGSSSAFFRRLPTTNDAATAATANSSAAAAQSLPASNPPLVPTDTIKLEFSNYAHVDVRRLKASYAFSWWGHRYVWSRTLDQNLGTTSFHLFRDGRRAAPIAHIVPEVRCPIQIAAEQRAGGWIPPCYMWISDPVVVEAVTDVAEYVAASPRTIIVVATGLMALVDHSIREHWLANKPRRPRTSLPHFGVGPPDADPTNRPAAGGIRRLFSPRPSTQHSHSPLRLGRRITVY
ncbi:hypothetical protein RJ55_04125 [Drechmeria coniospora]|nr:hypothetical protein RJ55_04125 [Drechmeria coniospora]